MNILFFYTGEIIPERGGVQRVTKFLADYFSSWAKVYFLSLRRESDHLKDNYFYLPDTSALDTRRNRCYFKDLLENLKINVVINQAAIWEREGHFCCQLTKDKGVRLLSVIHSDPFLYQRMKQKLELVSEFSLKNRIKRALIPFYLFEKNIRAQKYYSYLSRYSEKVIFLSDGYKQKVGDRIKNDSFYRDNLMSIPNFIELDLGMKPDICHKEKLILYVGRINFREKRVDDLIRIWSELWQQFPDWQFILLGDGEHMDEARKMVDDMGVKNICFKGYCSPEEYYQRGSIICLSSLFEGFGMALIEAQSQGCVPIAYNSYDAIYDIIEDGVNGRLVTAFERNEYIKKLAGLMNDEEKRSEMAENALISVKRYASELIVKNWKEIILN